ncbi:MAG: SulP family inorganic anion transporter [Actinobacteria bacterium]|nr:SulP family inorganic anion transporter [Actinomycetota bacterium]
MRWLPFHRDTLRQDAVAGLVLGVQSVPDGLATGLLAGVNPLSGLYGYMLGTLGGALVTSSAFMAVQGTGAMAMIVVDVPAVHEASDPARALFTLSVLTGVVMLAAGLLRLGSVLRFVSNAVMVGFINAVGVNIVLGQLANLTGFAADGPNRVIRAIQTLLNPGQWDLATLAIGVATVVLIVLLERTRVGAMGLVVAVIVTSAAAAALDWTSVPTLNDLGVTVSSLPRPEVPMLALIPVLLLPAISLAFVGLVQGAGISASFPNPDGRYPDASRDFLGQGVANVASGIFQGMPVGGSVSATALNRAAGARSRQSLVFTALVMAVVVVAFGGVVGHVAMPALAGLLILIGIRTIKPENLRSVWGTGTVQKVVLVVTFALTMIIPLQYAVLVAVALSILLHVVRQSNRVTLKRQQADADGHLVESDPPSALPAGEVVILQPYGSLFFASAPVVENLLPSVSATSRGSVVLLRLRGRDELGSTFMQMLLRYARELTAVDSRLVLVSTTERVEEQATVAGLVDVMGSDALYRGDERAGATLKRAVQDAQAWVASRT